jgi:hypothetical protein
VVYHGASALKGLNAWKLERRLRDLLDLPGVAAHQHPRRPGEPRTNTPAVSLAVALACADGRGGHDPLPLPPGVAQDLRALEQQVAAWLVAASGSGSGGLLGGASASCADLALGLPLHLARLRHRAFWVARPSQFQKRRRGRRRWARERTLTATLVTREWTPRRVAATARRPLAAKTRRAMAAATRAAATEC